MTDSRIEVGDVEIGMLLKYMAITYAPRGISYSFNSTWNARSKSTGERLGAGDFSFELDYRGTKPRKLELTGIANANLTQAERTAVAVAIKADLKRRARECIGKAYQDMQTQLLQTW